MFLRNVFLQFFLAKCFKKSPIFNVSYTHPKNSVGFNGIRIHDLYETGAMLYQLSYEATQLGGDQFVGVMCCDKSTNEGKKFVLLKCRDKVRGSLLSFVPISMLVYNLKVLSELPPVNRMLPNKIKVHRKKLFLVYL